MSTSTFYVANRLFSMNWSLGAIARHLEMTEDEKDELAFFLCDKYGVETVFPQKQEQEKELIAA